MKWTEVKAKLRREAQRLARQVSGSANDDGERALYLDFSEDERAILKAVTPYTMTSPERVAVLIRAVDYLIGSRIEGDFVECGVAAGGSVMAMALRLKALGAAERKLWLYDTFAGMSEPTDQDRGRYGEMAKSRYGQLLKNGVSTWINHSLESVATAVATTGYPADRIEYVQGKVEETVKDRCPDKIALLRLDTDWYESTKAEMETLWPRLAIGGIALADDYYRWRGSRKAIDDYLSAKGIRAFWARIDDHAAIAVKQL